MGFEPHKPDTPNRFVIHRDGRIGVTVEPKGPNEWVVAFIENGPLEIVPAADIEIAPNGGPNAKPLRKYAQEQIVKRGKKDYPIRYSARDVLSGWPLTNDLRRYR